MCQAQRAAFYTHLILVSTLNKVVIKELFVGTQLNIHQVLVAILQYYPHFTDEESKTYLELLFC